MNNSNVPQTISASRIQTKAITKTGLMAALICLATFFFKVPSLHGYTHLGDGFIFIAVWLLGTKKGAAAGGIGAALSDMIGGYPAWIVPTFFIKVIMSVIMGTIAYKAFNEKKAGFILGSVLGGLVQIALYTLVKIPLYDMAYALTGIPKLFIQTGAGIVVMIAVMAALEKANLTKKLREM